jgi:hypothetical protein
MVALAIWRDNQCSGCGGDLTETTAEENDGSPGHSAYVPLYPIRCHRCTALAASEKQYSSNPDVPHPHALMHQVELRHPRYT